MLSVDVVTLVKASILNAYLLQEAASMSKGQIRSAVQRKRKAEKNKKEVGKKLLNVSTFARKKNA